MIVFTEIPIPYGTKATRIKWGRYQKNHPDENQVRKWFGSGNRNIAVVLGPVSGDLVCRDFDNITEYKQWQQTYPDLANKLPTVKTSKGMHVYFEAHIDGTKHIDNGELRGMGGYCLLPPSIHPEGQVYEWVNPLTNGNLLAIEPELAGFLPENSNVTERTENTERTEENRGELKEIKVSNSIEEAIIKTQPKEFRTRHRRIFDFARELYSMPEYTDADPKQFHCEVIEWQKRALPNIRTKEFEETWIDFLKAWGKIRCKIGEEPMTQIFKKAIQREPPKIAIEKYPQHDKLKVLVSLCRELQRAAGQNPFFLSARTAGKLLDISPMQASRWLFLLQSDGIVKLVCKGGTAETVRKASRYQYIAN